jgi:hypothetical protein
MCSANHGCHNHTLKIRNTINRNTLRLRFSRQFMRYFSVFCWRSIGKTNLTLTLILTLLGQVPILQERTRGKLRVFFSHAPQHAGHIPVQVGKLKNPDLQRLQLIPEKFGLHLHRPRRSQLAVSPPLGSQEHPAIKPDVVIGHSAPQPSIIIHHTVPHNVPYLSTTYDKHTLNIYLRRQ